MLRLISALFCVALLFAACKGKTDANTNTATSSATTAATTATANSAAPAPAKEVTTPASLSSLKVLTLPFKLDKGLQEGDLDQLGWAVGTKMYFRTSANTHATLACTDISDTNIMFEVQAYDNDGKAIGKAETLNYFTVMTDAAATLVSECALTIDADGKFTLNCEDSYDGTTSPSQYRYAVTPQGAMGIK